MYFAFLLANKFDQYLRYYKRYAIERWDNMTPMEYGSLLIFIAVVGWILMRNSMKR